MGSAIPAYRESDEIGFRSIVSKASLRHAFQPFPLFRNYVLCFSVSTSLTLRKLAIHIIVGLRMLLEIGFQQGVNIGGGL